MSELQPSPLSDGGRSPYPLAPEHDDVSPLLEDLRASSKRYEELSRAFHDCHLAIRDLKDELAAEMPVEASALSTLRTVVDRLDDVNEDVRVELEIQAADDARLVEGYTALLALSGQLGGLAPRERADVETEIQAFVSGSDPKTARSLATFARKRAELEHDIADAKRALHALSAGGVPHSASPAASPSPEPELGPGRKWTAWTSGLFSASRASSPAPPSFGHVITTPRLRASASAASLRAAPEDPLARLGLALKTPMPTHLAAPAPAGPAAPKARYTSMFGQSLLGVGVTRSLTPLGAYAPRSVSTPFVSLSAAQFDETPSLLHPLTAAEDDDVE
jgi:hypothetical protein